MSTNISTPPPKATRGRHQHSTSETPGDPNTSHTTPVRNNKNRQKSNRHNHDQTYHSESQAVESHTDVEYQKAGNMTDDGVAGSESVQKARRKRPPKAKRSPNHGHEGHVASPHRNYSHNTAAEPNPAVTPGPKQMAYAGPTFHASPAPSTLPKPRFFSKSMPADVNESGLQARMEADQGPSPPPVEVEAAVPPRNEESPLDFLFNSDRAHKAKRNSGLSMPNEKLERNNSYGSSFSGNSRQHNRQPSAGSGRLFPIELDGSDTSAAYHENGPSSPNEIFKSNRSVTSPSTLPRARNPHHDQENMSSQSLRAKLFGPTQDSPIGSSSKVTPARPDVVPDFHSPSPFNRPGPGSRSTSGPSTPLQQQDQAPIVDPYHYGNRNLSPLFKAAQGDPRQRSSGLRQEISSPQQPRFSASSRDAQPARPGSSNQFGPLHNDNTAFTRNFLNSHIANDMHGYSARGPPSTHTQHVPRYSNAPPNGPAYRYHASSASPASNVPGRAPPNHDAQPTGYYASSTGGTASSGVQDMESRLRQMLNLGGGNGGNTGAN